jgi:hypothetical protein
MLKEERIAEGRQHGFACIARPRRILELLLQRLAGTVYSWRQVAIKFPKLLSTATTPALSAQNHAADLKTL